ncbi:MAG TPA: 4Fe-4S dicluster domain-containing protein [Odoribacter splanchnicus]|nr:4Fe-4S dicluster domain-containing protein [Odoribacter splanchnicus]HJG19550.1 4Fe-4S dicluster domain-containing protein [Odoribacter splanchnicus]
MKRTIIKIDDSRCNGCGLCVKGCHEGALQLIEGKAVLVSELYCDGLGACLGACPQQAIELEEREAEAYDERKVMQRLLLKGEKVISAHLRHLATQGQQDYLQQAIDVLEENHLPIPVPANKSTPQNSFLFHATPTSATGGCPGSRNITFTPQSQKQTIGIPASAQSQTDTFTSPVSMPSELQQWPVQLHLLSPTAPWLKKANLLVAADCTAYSAGDFHTNWLRGKRLAIACPKLDHGQEIYLEKLITMIDEGGIDTLTVMIMEVPCCSGLLHLCQKARQKAKRNIPLKMVKISLQGEILEEIWL